MTACAGTQLPGSVSGECRLVHTPTYAVRGKTKYDQNYVDEITEKLVAGCGQPRPRVRPASFDQVPIAAKPVIVSKPAVLPKPKPVAIKPAKPLSAKAKQHEEIKRRWWNMKKQQSM